PPYVFFSAVIFLYDPASPQLYSLSLHDALPISGRVGVDADPANRATGIVNRLLPGDGARTQGTAAGGNDWCWLRHSHVGCPDVWGCAWLIAKRMLLTSSRPS